MEELNKDEVKWWYQAIDHGTVEDPDLRVHEVYFNTVNKRIVSHTVNPFSLEGYESKDEIIKDLELIIEDLRRVDNEVLDVENVNQIFERNKANESY